MKIKSRTSKIEMTHESMVDLASHLNRPEHYNDDLMVHDLDVLKQYPGKKFIWILRSHGTHLVPLQLGVDPAWVERAATDKNNYCFVIDPNGGVISKITGEKAVHLINQMPLKSFPLQKHLLEEKVNEVLSSCHFGVFNQPQISVDDWHGWYEYFRINNLALMTHFMRRVISHKESLVAR